MKFHEVLNAYCHQLECTSRELALRSGLSETTISRYRGGVRIPKANSQAVKSLVATLAAVSSERSAGLSNDVIRNAFNECLRDTFDFDVAHRKMDALLSAFSVRTADLARMVRYDPSYLSRIRNGNRRPSDPYKFANEIARGFSRNCDTEEDLSILADLLNVPADHLEDPEKRAQALYTWLTSAVWVEKTENVVSEFLKRLDDFDLSDYIRTLRFDKYKMPPFSKLTGVRIYFGVEEMKDGELDFLKATVMSKSKEPVFMSNDMQIDDMAADVVFLKKYMFGLSLILKKGLRFNVVHNLNRPFSEMILGLVSWIPLYMTGRISPYYIKGVHNTFFCHALNVSGSAALSGECISGFHENGIYYLTAKKRELAYFKERAAEILSKAQPLMDIYRSDSKNLFYSFLKSHAEDVGKKRHVFSTLPIYTIEKNDLAVLLKKRNIPEDKGEKIIDFVAKQREWFSSLLPEGLVDEIPLITKEEFEAHPLALDLSRLFIDEVVYYDYESYLKHYASTLSASERHNNYVVIPNSTHTFRNIQISIMENRFIIISKINAPTIHFVIYHSKLRTAIEHLSLGSEGYPYEPMPENDSD